jgi:hypothetical protein
VALAFAGCVHAIAPRPSGSSPPVQASAARLLRAPELVVHVEWLAGAAPSDAELEGAREFLLRYARPERGVRIVQGGELPSLEPPDVPVPDAVLWQVARTHRVPPDPTGAATIRLLFVPRLASDGSGRGERGRAFPSESFAAIGQGGVRDATFLTVRSREVSRFVVQHELGHLLGLVSNPAHDRDGHCTNPTCILYAGPDLRAVLANFWWGVLGRLPESLDADCEHDLEALRAGRGTPDRG